MLILLKNDQKSDKVSTSNLSTKVDALGRRDRADRERVDRARPEERVEEGGAGLHLLRRAVARCAEPVVEPHQNKARAWQETGQVLVHTASN